MQAAVKMNCLNINTNSESVNYNCTAEFLSVNSFVSMLIVICQTGQKSSGQNS